jgi:NitT/TauT family transport system substrate-binding protein
MLLQAILRREGIGEARTRFLQQVQRDEGVELFRAGLGDYLLAAPPLSEVLVEEGVAHVAVTLAEAGGLIPWSVYYAAPEFVDRSDNVAGRFSRAIQRGLAWTLTHDPAEVAQVVRSHFAAVPHPVLARAIGSGLRTGVWTDTVRVSPEGLSQWQDMLVQAGLIDAPVPYAAIVDERAARWVSASSPGRAG